MRQVRAKASGAACWSYASVATLFVLVYFANPHPTGLPDWAPRFPLYICLNASAVVAIVVGIRRWRPDPALPWWLMAIGQAVYTAGDLVFYWGRYISHVNQFPGLADVFFLGRVPFVVAGLVLIIRRRSGRDRAAMIDCLIVGVAAGVLSWVFLMEPYTQGSLGLAARIASFAYPVTDLMLVALAVRLLAGVGRRGASFYLLTGGLILLALTDSLYGWQNLHGVVYESGSLVEAGWLLYYVIVGACGLHPSMRGLAAPIPRERLTHSRARLAVLGAAALACPVLLITESAFGQRIHASPIALGSIAAFVLVLLRLADVMHHQQAAEVLVRHQAFHDGLTGLANRALFYDRLEHAIDLSRREQRGLAVLLIDLDHFKPINDSLGHAAGDELLVSVGQRISGCIRANDTAARLGGDEFVVLAEGVTTVDDAREVAERVIGALTEPFRIAAATMSVRASIGVAFAPTGAGSADELLNNADAAMYAAKRAGAGTYRVFELSMLAAMSSVDRIALDAESRRAVVDGEHVFT